MGIVMEWGVTLDDYNKCGYPNPEDPNILCDQTDGICKPGCHQHEDCNDIEYCDCDDGGTFEVAVTNSIGVAGCTTPKLDKAGTTDYGAGNTATFSGDELGPNSGGCKLYEAFGVTGVTVAWSGAGSWTPETVNVNHVLQTCCPNVGGGTASSSQPLKLECSQFLC